MGLCQSQENKNSLSIKNLIRGNKKTHKINSSRDDREDKILENVTIKKNPVDKKSIKNIQQALKKHFLFFNLNISQFQQIIQKMFYCQTQQGQYVFKKGDNASSFFIIDSGQLCIQVFPENNSNIINLKKGQSFGQLALIYNAKRSASAFAKSKCSFWCISRSTFKQTLIDIVGRTYNQARPYMDKVSLFQHLTKKQKDAVSHAMTLLKYEKGQYVFKQKDDANSFFIIKEGQVIILENDIQVNKMKEGDSFGDQALFETSLRSASVKAQSKAMILSVGRQQLQNILGDNVLKVIYININRRAINKSSLLSKLTAIQIQKILSQVLELKAHQKQTIFKQGQYYDKIIFCTKITLVNQKNLQVVCQQGKVYGQNYLLAQNQKTVLLQTIIVKQQGVYGVITFDTIKKIFQKPFQQILEQNKRTHFNANQTKDSVDYSCLSLQNLINIKRLGYGQFGNVYLVKQKNKNKLFALKCIQKQQVIQNRMQKITIQQKKILEMIQFPFIMHFYRTFKDDFFLYLLLEHVRGVQLFDVLRQIGLVNNTISRFYLCSIILAIQYLHSNNIIYRDLKPQNILVQTNGYLRLIDLGTAKILDQAKGFKTFTIIGTPNYMGPQVMQGKGYSFSSDLWSIGVMFYQFICGQLPYAQNLEDPYQIYYEVMKNPLIYPQGFNNPKAKKLIDQLLNKSPEYRLGRSWAALKANVYFDGFDWNQLLQKTMPSPYTSRLCASQDYKIKSLADGKPFLQEIMKQKKKLKKAKSQIPNWDSQF